jgi:uncharacterized membrane protein
MLPSPLHPAVVHFPIVLMFMLPLAALGALWAIRHGSRAARAWAVPALVAAALTASAWVAVETGESDEERAEDVVGEQTIGAHEAAAERFLALSGAVLVLTVAGLAGGTLGRTLRVASAVAALGLVGAGYQVGHSGGRVVYGDATTRGLAALSPATAEGNHAEGSRGLHRQSRDRDD